MNKIFNRLIFSPKLVSFFVLQFLQFFFNIRHPRKIEVSRPDFILGLSESILKTLFEEKVTFKVLKASMQELAGIGIKGFPRQILLNENQENCFFDSLRENKLERLEQLVSLNLA